MVWTMLKTMGSVLWSLVKSFKWVFIIIGVFFLILAIDFLIVKFRYFRNSKREVIGHINFDGKVSIFEQLFIQLPKQFWTNYYNKKIGTFTEHGIIMFTGKQGQGKTLAETKYLMDMQYKYPAVKVCTNCSKHTRRKITALIRAKPVLTLVNSTDNTVFTVVIVN